MQIKNTIKHKISQIQLYCIPNLINGDVLQKSVANRDCNDTIPG